MKRPRHPGRLRVAVVQNDAGEDWKRNLKKLHRLTHQALRCKPHLIAFPETFYHRGPSADYAFLSRFVTAYVLREFSVLARRHGVAFLLGSVLEPSGRRGKYYNTSLLISERGRLAARYRKIHLFDNRIRELRATESRHIHAGRQVTTGRVFGVRAGLSVCYDLRFPELYRKLQEKGSRMFFVPANFTDKTGKAHWEVLLRARAIENQAFVIAPGQVGRHPRTGVRSHGHSMIIDPWGRILKRAGGASEEVIWADLDLRQQQRLRMSFPALRHRRF